MKAKSVIKFIPVAVMLALLAAGCTKQTSSTAQASAPKAMEQKTDTNIYKGPSLVNLIKPKPSPLPSPKEMLPRR